MDSLMQNGLTANQAKHTKNHGHCMRNLLKKPRSGTGNQPGTPSPENVKMNCVAERHDGKHAYFSTVPSGRILIGDMNPAHCAGLISDVPAGTKAGLMLKWNF
jgi:hypothetical protein